MSKSAAGSTLYRLIEAGHLARQALAAPLEARGLEPGDDAVLLGLKDAAGATRQTLEEFTGLSPDGLETRLARMEDRGLLLRIAVGPQMEAGARLTAQGHATRKTIEDHWAELERALAAELGDTKRKHLRKGLKAIIALLDAP